MISSNMKKFISFTVFTVVFCLLVILFAIPINRKFRFVTKCYRMLFTKRYAKTVQGYEKTKEKYLIRIEELVQQDKYDDTTRCSQEILDLAKKKFGAEDPIYINSREEQEKFLVELKNDKGKIKEADTNKHLDLTPLNPDFTMSKQTLYNLTEYYKKVNNLSISEIFLRRLLEVDIKLIGVNELSNLSEYYKKKNNYAIASLCLKRLLEISVQQSGVESEKTNELLYTLVNIYKEMGNYNSPAQLLDAKINYMMAKYKVTNINFQSRLNSMMIKYKTIKGVETEINTSISGMEKEIAALNNRLNSTKNIKRDELEGILESIKGLRARINEEEQLRKFIKTNVDASINTLGSISNLAKIYKESDEYSNAMMHLKEKFSKFLEDKQWVYSILRPETQYILGMLYEGIRNLTTSEFCYKQYLEIKEKVLGPTHPDIIAVEINLGKLYFKMGKYDQAESLFKKVIDAKEKLINPPYQEIIVTQNNLAETYFKWGKLSDSVSLYNKSISIIEKAKEISPYTIIRTFDGFAKVYYRLGDYNSSESFFKRGLELRQKINYSDSPDIAIGLDNLAFLYQTKGNYKDAESLYKSSLDIRKNSLGSEHPDTAKSLNNLGALYVKTGNFNEAKNLLQNALSIIEKARGPNHKETAIVLSSVAELSYKTKDFTSSENLFLRAIKIFEKENDTQNIAYLSCLTNLGRLYFDQGKYTEAEPLLTYAMKIREDTWGIEHPDTDTTLEYVAELYLKTGNYSTAESLYKRLLGLREKKFGLKNLNTISVMNTLGKLYREMGYYASAEPLLKKSLNICETTFGLEDLNTAECLNNLAEFYKTIGNYPSAEPLYKRAINIYEKKIGKNQLGAVNTLTSMGDLSRITGKYADAENYYKLALDIREKKLGAENIQTAQSLDSLAELYSEMQNYSTAEALFKRSASIKEKVLGPEHPEVATSLKNLGALYFKMGNLTIAENLYRRAFEIKEKKLGSENPDTAKELYSLADMFIAQGKYQGALDLILKAINIENKLFEQIIAFSSEKERFQFVENVTFGMGYFLSVCVNYLKNDPKALTAGFEYVLSRKGIILDSLISEQEIVSRSIDPEILAKWDKLTNVRRQLSHLAFTEANKENVEASESKKEELEIEANELQKDLARLCNKYRKDQSKNRPKISSIINLLPDDSALIEFVCYNDYDFNTVRMGKKLKGLKYIAYILKKNEQSPILVDLGSAQNIDNAIHNYRNIIQEFLSVNLGQERDELKKSFQQTGEVVANLVLKPLEPHFKGLKQIYIAPDGELNLLPFNALVDKNNNLLIKSYSIVFLNSGRDFLRFTKGERKGTIKILAAPDYDTISNKIYIADANTSKQAFRSFLGRDIFSGARFNPLMDALYEAALINSLFSGWGFTQCETLLGKDATETNLKLVDSPRVLHLATHGFFLQNSGIEDILSKESRDVSFVPKQQEEKEEKGKQPIKNFALENPMHRSGIALAGANRLLRGEKIPENEDDGIVTAEEIASLKLFGTDLVVLSACKTGVGEVKRGEGVMGLRRAFSATGAQTLVMSLWSVPDVQTKELMKSFYNNWLSGRTKSEAMRSAQLELIDKMEKQYGFAPPSHWAAFVLSGNPE